jgi:aspartate ammonia-lyase
MRERCIEGIRVNEDITRDYFRYSNAISTLLSPLIGYDAASRLAKEAEKTKKTVGEVAIDKGLVTENEMARILEHATEPNLKIIHEIKEERKIDQET